MVNYNNGKIYKIEAINGDEGDVYIGSTTKELLSQRMSKHRSQYKNWMNGIGSKITSYVLFEKYGMEKCKIVLMENVNATSSDELRAREAFYIKSMECVNKVIPMRSYKEYCTDNKEIIKDKRKLYYENNKDVIKEQKKGYREDNKDNIKVQQEQWNKDNKDKIKLLQKNYREKNKEILKIKRKEYDEQNKEKSNLKRREKYLKKKLEILDIARPRDESRV
jgi:hypothetical protein